MPLLQVPVAYAKSTPSKTWEPFARLVLRGAYEATLTAAALIAAREKRRVKVFLTMLGGGAFGNRSSWIRDAMNAALACHRDSPLDVFLVHYGSTIQSEYKDVAAPHSPPPGSFLVPDANVRASAAAEPSGSDGASTKNHEEDLQQNMVAGPDEASGAESKMGSPVASPEDRETPPVKVSKSAMDIVRFK